MVSANPGAQRQLKSFSAQPPKKSPFEEQENPKNKALQ